MSRDYKLYLEDILEAIKRIEQYLYGIDSDTFNADIMRIDAVLRNLEIIGEATKNIPPSIRDMAPAVEWRKIAGLRDVVAHHYFDIDLNIIWDIVQHKIPDLQREVTMLLSAPDDSICG